MAHMRLKDAQGVLEGKSAKELRRVWDEEWPIIPVEMAWGGKNKGYETTRARFYGWAIGTRAEVIEQWFADRMAPVLRYIAGTNLDGSLVTLLDKCYPYQVRWPGSPYGHDVLARDEQHALEIHRAFFARTVTNKDSYAGRTVVQHVQETTFYCDACRFAPCKWSSKQ